MPSNQSLRPNVITSFNATTETPQIDGSAYIDPKSSVTGHVQVGQNVLVGPFASLRGDEGGPIFIGNGANVQDGVVIHALETEKDGSPVKANQVKKEGKSYAVYIGNHVSLAHQSQVHGPALIEDEKVLEVNLELAGGYRKAAE